jgi:hypothetical protein
MRRRLPRIPRYPRVVIGYTIESTTGGFAVGGRENDWLYEEEPEAEDSGPQLWAGIANELNAMQAPDSGATYGQRYDAQGALDSYAQAVAAAESAGGYDSRYLPGEPVEGPPAWGAPIPGEFVEGPPAWGPPLPGEFLDGPPAWGPPLPGELIEGLPAQEDLGYLPGESSGYAIPPELSYSYSDNVGGQQQSWIDAEGRANFNRAPSYSEEETYISPEDLRK